MPDTQRNGFPAPWTPTIRYRHDADELRRLADWLAIGEEYQSGDDGASIAVDYFRLADRLAQLADDAREFARTMAGPLP